MWPPDCPPLARRRRSSGVRLTATQIEALQPCAKLYELTDPGCAGLKLRVRPSGAKVWAYRFYWLRRRQLLQLGAWPTMGLTLARERALACRHALRECRDPRHAGIVRTSHGSARMHLRDDHATESQAPRCVSTSRPRVTDLADNPGEVPPDPHSVQFLAHEFYHRHIIGERGYLRPAYVKDLLNRDVLPFWAQRDARTIQPRDVIELLDRIVDRGAKVMANRVAATIGQLFRYGIHRGIMADTPVKLLYPPGGPEPSRERVFSAPELKAFLLNCRTLCRGRRLAHVLMVLLLTLQRRQELAWARQRDFDLAAGTWLIPDEHAKGRRGQRRGHVLPLSLWATQEIRALMALAGESPYLLPRKDGSAPINPAVITGAVRRLQGRFQAVGIQPWTPHDLRRTGRTGLAALGVNEKIAERVINHKSPRIQRVYDLHTYFDEKRDALNRWAKHLAEMLEASAAEQNGIRPHRVSEPHFPDVKSLAMNGEEDKPEG